MDKKIFFTMGMGYGIIITQIIVFVIVVPLLSILAYYDEFSIAFPIIAAILLIASIISLIRNGYVNYIKLDSKCIRHKRTSYSWDKVFITMTFFWPKFVRNEVCFVYFNNHYLTEQEIRNESKMKGFYIMLTPKRARYLFRYYNKQIMQVGKTPYEWKRLVTMVQDHNNSIGS